MPGPDPSLVRGFPFFRNLPEDDLGSVLRTAQTRRIPRKAAVFSQGDAAREFFVLLHGHLKVTQTTPDGRQIIVRIVEPGELYGMAVAIGRTDYPATATAMEDSITLAWPSSAWAGMVARVPALAANALQTIGQRVQEAHIRVRELSTEEVERRVAHLLLRITHSTGEEPTEAVSVPFPISREDIAELTGTTLHTVSRVLSGWESQGLVAGGREQVTIRDPARLRLIAERRDAGN
jgi:CRP/FNR family transcriptional regulator, nitrogen oxide reductase regulator